MTRLTIHFIIVAILFGALTSMPNPGRAATGETAEISTHRAKLDELKQQIERLQAKLSTERIERDRHRQRLQELERSIVEIRRQQKATTHDINKNQSESDALRVRQQHTSQELAKHRSQLKGLIRASYLIGKQEYLKVLLSQRNPNDIGRMMTYYQYLARSRASQIEEISNLVQTLEILAEEVRNKQTELVTLQSKLDSDRKRLESAHTERGETLNAITRSIENKDRKIVRLRDDADRLTKLVTKLQRIVRQTPAPPPPNSASFNTETSQGLSFAQMKGRLALPLRATVQAYFGQPKADLGMQWEGLLLSAPEGEEVRAIFDGQVVYADWLRGFGLLLILDHGDGYMSLYSHNQALQKQLGEWVVAGEIIANVGTTGGLSEPGLYFEVRYNGNPADPLTWCQRG